MKILILILSITPTIALSQINLEDWKFDTRYSYSNLNSNTQGSISSNNNGVISSESSIYNDSIKEITKEASINLYLDSKLSKNIDITGVFTLADIDSNNNQKRFKPDFVRQLYVTHKTKDGTSIKAGKLSSEVDKSKLVQNLDVNCDGNFGEICDGLDSIYINTETDKSTLLEFLASKSSYTYTNINTYAASIKRTIKDNDYYFRIFQRNYSHKTLPSLDSDNLNLSISGELAVNNSQTDKLEVSLGYSDSKYKKNIDSIDYGTIYYYSRVNNRAYINLSSLIFIDDFKIIPKAGYARLSNDYTTNNIITQTLDSTPAKMVTNHIGVNIEYPIQKGTLSFGKIVSNQTNTASAGDLVQDLKIHSTQASVFYNLNKNISLKLNYITFNVSGSDGDFNIFNNVYEQNSKITSLETVYKF